MNDLQQYQRQACVLVDRIKPADGETEVQIKENVGNVLVKNLGFDEEIVDNEIHKCHRLGKSKRKKQLAIIRFKTHCFRTAVYENRKIIKSKKLKVKLLLTKKRTKSFAHLYKMVE